MISQMMHRDIEQPLSPLSMMKDESNSSPTQITLMNTTTIEDNIDDDTTSHPGTLVINEEIDSEIDTRGCWRCCCDASSLSKRGSTTFWFFAVVTSLIIAAGTLTAVVFKVSHMTSMNIDNDPSVQPPSASSSNIQHTETYYQERYERFFQELMITFNDEEPSLSILLTTPETPQYRAFNWMVYDDSTIGSESADTTITTFLVQRYIIMVLYYACGGEAWQMGDSITSGSAASTSIEALGHIETCEWGKILSDHSFIACSTVTKEIVALQLDQKRLIGQLPKELFALSSLVTLDLSYNFLKGTLPSNMFSQLLQLETLRLNNNEFVGPLPTSLGQLVALQELILGYNYFTGSIPREYESLTQLQHFHVKGISSLQGPFFAVFGERWTKLRFLIVDGTALTGTIPSNVITAWSDSIVDIELGKSLFSGTFPAEIGRLSRLTNLNSIGMNMHGLFPNITTLTSLKYLTIEGSAITGMIPTGIGTLTELKELSIRYTSISGTIPTELALCKKLESFTITNTNISGTIPVQLTNNVPALSLITLQENLGLEGSSIPDTVCPYIESGLVHVSISCNIECTCCIIDNCLT